MQGWRTGMEDSHLACVDLAGASSAKAVKEPPAAKAPISSPSSSSPVVAAFAVFDGHVSFKKFPKKFPNIITICYE